MNIAKIAIEKNRITTVALVLTVFAGISTYNSMPRAEDPGFTIRTAVVTAYFPGASPDRVEQLVTDKIEEKVQRIPELDEVRSVSKNGVSIVYVDIRDEFDDIRPIWDNLRRKMEEAARDLPSNVRGPYVNDEYGDVYGVILTVTGEGFSYARLKDVADEVRDELLFVPDVAKVDIVGVQDERIFVEFSNARLARYGLSPSQLQDILKKQNIVLSGGEIYNRFEAITLEPTGNFETVDDIRRAVVQLPNSDGLVALEDLADIHRSYIDPPQRLMRSNGVPSLGLAVSMSDGGNIITMGEDITRLVDRLAPEYPLGLEISVAQFQPEAVSQKISAFQINLLQSVAVVTLVMLITLGLRSGLIVASLVPMAMVSAIAVMGLLGIGLDQMSLAALIIALGMLVDNAIVMSESTMTQMSAGKPARQAAIDAAGELTIPLLTSSLTTAAAFLPIFITPNSTGEYTGPIFSVVTITLLCSWILALTMVPMLCTLFLKVKVSDKPESFDSMLYKTYRRLLMPALRRPLVVVAGAVLLLVVALRAFSLVPVIFFPPNDRPTFTLDLEMPVGSPIERTVEVADAMDEYIRSELAAGEERQEGISSWTAYLGEPPPRFILTYAPPDRGAEIGVYLLNATSRPEVDRLMEVMGTHIAKTFPDVKAVLRPLALGPPAWPPVEIRIAGSDKTRIFEIVDMVKDKLRSIPGTYNIDDDWGAETKKLVVDIDQARATRAHVSSQDIAVSLQTYLTGLETTEFREGDDLIPVTLRAEALDRNDMGNLEGINVYSQSTGVSVPLKQVADVRVAWQSAQIQRRDRRKTVSVESGVSGGITAHDVNTQLRPWLEEISAQWPVGYSWEFGGEEESSSEANAALVSTLPLAGMFIVLLLVMQFNSIRKPLIILMTIPLGIIGVVVGLLVARSYFGFMTFLGIISLSGIVINNAIVLLDRIQTELDEFGREPQAAVIEAAQRRLRPILLTTATTVTGLLPLYLGGGPMWEPLAIAIMAGLIFATMLTLCIVPVLYALFFNVNFTDYTHD
ncbi:MAG: efflux RND transporter permease subunit [Deltaproteobacteria bacterium]|nr:efflux RND transporter permease subunit [Deltaproteobacteria bacterium]